MADGQADEANRYVSSRVSLACESFNDRWTDSCILTHLINAESYTYLVYAKERKQKRRTALVLVSRPFSK